LQNHQRLIVLAPDLIQLAQASSCPNLSLLLSRGKSELQSEFEDFPSLLLSLMGLTNTHQQIPTAALELLASGSGESETWYCKASPCVMMPNREHLAIMQSRGFLFSEEEAHAFCDELNHYFDDLQLTFFFTDPNQWYCRSNTPIATPSVSPHQILNENIMPYMPQSSEKMQWRVILNEVQMFLHHSVTNQKRVQEGKPEINSLWFWGAGVLPSTYSVNIPKIYSDDLFVHGLAELGGAQTKSLNLKQLSTKIENYSDSLIYFSDPSQQADEVNWAEDLSQLDASFFASIVNAIKQNTVKELVLYFEPQRKFIIRKSDLKKFWKPKKQLKEFLLLP